MVVITGHQSTLIACEVILSIYAISSSSHRIRRIKLTFYDIVSNVFMCKNMEMTNPFTQSARLQHNAIITKNL